MCVIQFGTCLIQFQSTSLTLSPLKALCPQGEESVVEEYAAVTK